MSYSLTVRAIHCIQGRHAEDLCGQIGLEPVRGMGINFEMGCSNDIPDDDTIDRIIPYGKHEFILDLGKDELHLLQPGDYRANRGTVSYRIGSVWDIARMVALYDRVMEFRGKNHSSRKVDGSFQFAAGEIYDALKISMVKDNIRISFEDAGKKWIPTVVSMSRSDAKAFAEAILRSLGQG